MTSFPFPANARFHDPGEIAQEDPFRGEGIFLSDSGEPEEILSLVDWILGDVPAVVWPRQGAWVKTTTAPEEVQARWERAKMWE